MARPAAPRESKIETAPKVKPTSTEGERLQKVLAAAGIASRRASEDLIKAGRVWVDGKAVTTLGTRVDKTRAKIEVDGVRIAVDPGREYMAFNKPSGIVTTAKDERGRTTVIDMMKTGPRIFPVGRLDIDTTGLLLLTNDGELAHRLAHPKYKVDRVYVAEVIGTVKPPILERLQRGVVLEDGPARAKTARIVGTSKNRTQIEIVMQEGRKREVRRMLADVGHPVSRLVRTAYGPIRLGNLPSGEGRRLSPAEVGELQRLVDM